MCVSLIIPLAYLLTRKGVGVFGNQVKDTGFSPDIWRYSLLANRPEVPLALSLSLSLSLYGLFSPPTRPLTRRSRGMI